MLIAPCSNFVKFNGCQRFGELHSRDVQKVDGSDSNEGNTWRKQKQCKTSVAERYEKIAGVAMCACVQERDGESELERVFSCPRGVKAETTSDS